MFLRITFRSLAILAVCLLLSACAKNSGDAFLDELENTVNKWEEKVDKGTVSSSDFSELAQQQLILNQKGSEIQEKTKFSDSQKKRLLELTNRWARVITKVSQLKYQP